jgi:hypothetical protein
VLFLLGRRSAADTLIAAKLLLEHGAREILNTPDSLGNTPLHGLVVRYVILYLLLLYVGYCIFNIFLLSYISIVISSS